MNEEPLSPESESLLDEYLAECLDRLDQGKNLAAEIFDNLPAEVAEELRELLRFESLLKESVEPVCESTVSNTNQESDVVPDAQGPEAPWSEATIQYTPAESSRQVAVSESSEVIGKAGDYELLEELGRGGMGVVFKARQVNLNRTVAVKMILSGRMASEEELQRFYSEACSVARLRHPNIVSIYEVKEEDGHHYYSMDFIEGRTLEDVARDGELSERQIARYVNLIAEAVEYAHQNGILHRDLKPSNVLIDSEDEPHVTDFGLAKQLEDDSGLTLSGTILGTPSFMSPEQASGRNEDVGPTSDVYALGAILYFLLTGHPPFRGRTAAETIQMVIHDEPHPIRSFNSRLSRAMVTICEKCLRKQPKDRYQSAQELAVELGRFLRGDPIQAQPVSRFRQCWVWCRDIPLVAALIGRTPSASNSWQRRFQWAVLSLFAIIGLFSGVNAIQSALLPKEIIIASGRKDGMYARVSKQLADSLRRGTGQKVQILETEGSIENRELLVTGKAHLGLMQASAVDIEKVAVIAPLYREFGHVIVRNNSPIQTLEGLQGQTIVVGREGSGNRVSALKILKFFGVNEETASFSPASFLQLRQNQALDAAIVVTGLDNPALTEILEIGEFRLLPIPPREEIFQATGFYPATLKSSDYSAAIDPPVEIATVATAALLVVRDGERSVIVKAACESLVREEWLETLPAHFSDESFLYLIKSLPMHPAAVEFFKSHPTSTPHRANE